MTIQGAVLVAVIGVLAAVAGLAGAVRAWNGKAPRSRPRPQKSRASSAVAELPERWRRNVRPLLALAAVAGVITWAWTGYPVHGLVMAAATAGLPFVLYPGGSAAARIERLEALAMWLNQLAGVHVAGLSLEQTVRASAKSAPAALRDPVNVLSGRLQAGWPADEAYRKFADDLADGVGDHVVLLLLTHARDRGPGLSRALEALAATVGQQAADFREMEADRAKVRASARWVSVFILAIVGLTMINGSYTAPYGSPLGQMLLTVLALLFAGVLWWLRHMAQTDPDPRLLTPEHPAAHSKEEDAK